MLIHYMIREPNRIIDQATCGPRAASLTFLGYMLNTTVNPG
jgi:hypothetical protein